jgi:hypothetical protein
VSGTVTVPDGMMITLWHSLASCTITPVRGILATPTQIEASYDGGSAGWWIEQPPHLIMFSFAFSEHITGRGMDEVNQIAATIASHLAAMAEDWPTQEAHVRLFPIVDFSMMWEVLPERQAEYLPPENPVLAHLRQLMPLAAATEEPGKFVTGLPAL